jgi:hypothetical protein
MSSGIIALQELGRRVGYPVIIVPIISPVIVAPIVIIAIDFLLQATYGLSENRDLGEGVEGKYSESKADYESLHDVASYTMQMVIQ